MAAPRPNRLRALMQAFATPSAATMAILGFGSGLPFLLVGGTLSTWLRDDGFALGLIGLVSYASLIYTLKFFWAPLLDRYPMPLLRGLGLRRGWLVASQLGVVVGLAALGILGPDSSLGVFVLLLMLVALSGATQDAVVDAYRIEIAPLESQAALAATYTFGYRMALIASGAGALYLAHFVDWRTAYLSMAGLMLLPMAAAFYAREPERLAQRVARRASLLEAFVDPFREFFRRDGVVKAVVLLAFVGMFKLPDQMLGVLAGPFYLDTGFTKADIATVSKLYGVWIGLLGAFAGGVAVALGGVRIPLLLAGLAIAGSNLLFLVMAIHPGELWAFVLAISGDNFAQGFGGTILIAFLSGLSHRNYTATQYALLSSLANLPGKLIGGVSGFLAEAWGYAGFFVFSSLSIVPTLLLLAWLWRSLAVPPSGPRSDDAVASEVR